MFKTGELLPMSLKEKNSSTFYLLNIIAILFHLHTWNRKQQRIFSSALKSFVVTSNVNFHSYILLDCNKLPRNKEFFI